ncbi:hypothetical protein RhiirA4_488913 [Rhizophagus irregularis]|uniref:Uncharacterized protein n=1 Tax=Rhizophagus irregularis TaxID=588596 RepID=A0A2I1HUC2_9GLOM|nr:hypothetical protein RhiirA4_488913 [Rhizophagus irregularis]
MGLYLPITSFPYGQLYVPLSRVILYSYIKILILHNEQENYQTENINKIRFMKYRDFTNKLQYIKTVLI